MYAYGEVLSHYKVKVPKVIKEAQVETKNTQVEAERLRETRSVKVEHLQKAL